MKASAHAFLPLAVSAQRGSGGALKKGGPAKPTLKASAHALLPLAVVAQSGSRHAAKAKYEGDALGPTTNPKQLASPGPVRGS